MSDETQDPEVLEPEEGEGEDDGIDAEKREPVDILNPATCPKRLKKLFNDVQRENLRDLVEKGDILRLVVDDKGDPINVTISPKASLSKKEEKWQYVMYL